jgi:SAM-dependent methyltransferase
MDHNEVGHYWNGNADAWTRLARAGYDVYRDALNTPAFLEMLPPVEGLRGLDVGCGEGHNTRLLARRGAKMTAVDIAERFVELAAAAPSARGTSAGGGTSPSRRAPGRASSICEATPPRDTPLPARRTAPGAPARRATWRPRRSCPPPAQSAR